MKWDSSRPFLRFETNTQPRNQISPYELMVRICLHSKKLRVQLPVIMSLIIVANMLIVAFTQLNHLLILLKKDGKMNVPYKKK